MKTKSVQADNTLPQQFSTWTIMALVLFMLCSGFVHWTFAGNQLRLLTEEERGTHAYSLSKCLSNHGSLVTLYDDGDATFLYNLESKLPFLLGLWLGLERKPDCANTWSNGSTCTYGASLGKVKKNQTCEAVKNKTRTSSPCSKKKAFMCYKGEDLHLIQSVRKNWCEAQQHCRRHFTDLVSVCDDEQNNKVLQHGNNQTYWIGLMHDEWEWADRSCSTYRKWSSDTDNKKKCTVFDRTTNLKQDDCSNERFTFCSDGNRRIITVDKNYTWEEALIYCEKHYKELLQIYDKRDQEAVEQWLENRQDVTGPFWIGLRQSRTLGIWILSDRVASYSNWARVPEREFYENCGVINGTDFKWSDASCLDTHHFLCEEEIQTF